MEILRGIVSRVNRSAEVSGNQQGFSTSQIVSCLINGRAVEIWMPNMPNIHEGDDLVVAGESKFGTLQVSAFRNLTNGSNGRWDYQIAMFVWIGISALVCLVFTCAIPFFGLFALALLAFIGFKIPQKIKLHNAYQAVMSYTPSPSSGSS